MHIRAPILDGNVKRVLTRYFAIASYPESSAVKARLWELAESLLPESGVAAYTQAMMDLGATLCTRSQPDCERCPLGDRCQALAAGAVAKYPGKKPRRDKPVKAVQMIILRNGQGEVLLEKRADTGIWGGLYSLPERPLARSTGQYEPAAYPVVEFNGLSCDLTAAIRLPEVRHSFTHYHLNIFPLVVETGPTSSTSAADSDRWLWYPLDHSIDVGLAAPVKKLLSRLAEDSRPITR